MSIEMCVDSSEIITGLSTLYVNQQLTDVQIVCSDGSLLAHKTVLASVSDKLLKMLSTDQPLISNAMTQTMVVFADISIEDIKPIIDCIYFGRQSISTNRFKHLTRIADNLGIGLTSAVSAAFATTNQNSLFECLHPKPAHQNSYLLNYKNERQTESTPFKDKPQTERSDEEKPIDLSSNITPEEVEANYIKIIESVATNGPQMAPSPTSTPTPNTRRRKQLDPKPTATKLVRFDEFTECFGGDTPINYDSFAEEMIAEFNPTLLNQLQDIRAQTTTAQIPTAQSPSDSELETQTTVQKAEENDTNKLEDISNPNSILKVKQLTRISKGMAISDDMLKDCLVCGKTHESHKQLITHLNNEHKTDHFFMCGVCGKKQKYAKTFAIHSLQCLYKKV